MKRILIAILSCICLCCAFSACDSEPDPTGISLDEFERLSTGMGYSEVIEIIGGHGEIISEKDNSGDGYYEKITLYKFKGEKSGYAEIEFTYHYDYKNIYPDLKDRKLTSKTQYDLS